jgi:hypothetical protein
MQYLNKHSIAGKSVSRHTKSSRSSDRECGSDALTTSAWAMYRDVAVATHCGEFVIENDEGSLGHTDLPCMLCSNNDKSHLLVGSFLSILLARLALHLALLARTINP